MEHASNVVSANKDKLFIFCTFYSVNGSIQSRTSHFEGNSVYKLNCSLNGLHDGCATVICWKILAYRNRGWIGAQLVIGLPERLLLQ